MITVDIQTADRLALGLMVWIWREKTFPSQSNHHYVRLLRPQFYRLTNTILLVLLKFHSA